MNGERSYPLTPHRPKRPGVVRGAVDERRAGHIARTPGPGQARPGQPPPRATPTHPESRASTPRLPAHHGRVLQSEGTPRRPAYGLARPAPRSRVTQRRRDPQPMRAARRGTPGAIVLWPGGGTPCPGLPPLAAPSPDAGPRPRPRVAVTHTSPSPGPTPQPTRERSPAPSVPASALLFWLFTPCASATGGAATTQGPAPAQPPTPTTSSASATGEPTPTQPTARASATHATT